MKTYLKKDIKLTQSEFDALAMRAYNGPKCWFGPYKTNGSTKVLEYINAGKDLKNEEFANNYQKLNTSGGKYMRGLEKKKNDRIRSIAKK